MTRDELRDRTRAFALEIIDLCLQLGADDLARLIRPQLLRAGTGVATNYRAACRGRSDREFASRLAVVTEESDECEFWLDVLQVRRRGPAESVAELRRESIELRAIAASARATILAKIKANKRRRRSANPPIPESPNP